MDAHQSRIFRLKQCHRVEGSKSVLTYWYITMLCDSHLDKSVGVICSCTTSSTSSSPLSSSSAECWKNSAMKHKHKNIDTAQSGKRNTVGH